MPRLAAFILLLLSSFTALANFERGLTRPFLPEQKRLAVVPGSVTALSSGTYIGVGYDARNRLNDFFPCTYS